MIIIEQFSSNFGYVAIQRTSIKNSTPVKALTMPMHSNQVHLCFSIMGKSNPAHRKKNSAAVVQNSSHELHLMGLDSDMTIRSTNVAIKKAPAVTITSSSTVWDVRYFLYSTAIANAKHNEHII